MPGPGFHQIDAAVWRAVLSSSAAEEIFDVAAALDALFGSGEGKLLLRAVAGHMAAGGHMAADPMRAGGTRKVAYISRVPANILRNLPVYLLSLQARLAWRRQGHGKQSLSSLISIGRRLCSVAFAAWIAWDVFLFSSFSSIVSKIQDNHTSVAGWDGCLPLSGRFSPHFFCHLRALRPAFCFGIAVSCRAMDQWGSILQDVTRD